MFSGSAYLRGITKFTAYPVQIPGKLWIWAIYSIPDQISVVAVMKLKAFFYSFTGQPTEYRLLFRLYEVFRRIYLFN